MVCSEIILIGYFNSIICLSYSFSKLPVLWSDKPFRLLTAGSSKRSS